MSNKDALQRYEPELPNPWYGRAAVVGILADAHAHYEAQVRQLGGLARPDADPGDAQLIEKLRAELKLAAEVMRRYGRVAMAHRFERAAGDVEAAMKDQKT